jgi:hypothetical protein
MIEFSKLSIEKAQIEYPDFLLLKEELLTFEKSLSSSKKHYNPDRQASED